MAYEQIKIFTDKTLPGLEFIVNKFLKGLTDVGISYSTSAVSSTPDGYCIVIHFTYYEKN